MDLNQFRELFRSRETAPAVPKARAGQRPAAVLILVRPGKDGAEVVFTRRSEALSSHAGQVSFPGGRMEADEDHVTAALREAREEIGLEPETVEVLGTLDWAVTTTGFVVIPVVAVSERRDEFIPDPAEVEDVFTVPLVELLESGRYRARPISINGINRTIYYFDYEEYYIWGLTAGLLRTLARVLAVDPS